MTKGKQLTMMVLLCALLAGGGYFLFTNTELQELFAGAGGELESAQIERALQNLLEQEPVPGALKIPIFIYHSVRPHIPRESKRQDEYDITPELLEKQLAYLKQNGFTAITLDELAGDIAAGTTFPHQKPIVLTFDDGWRNQYRYAFPLLKKYHLTATFYIYTNPIGKKHYLSWDEIKEMDKAGMTIADHTLSHPYFKTISLEQIKTEVTESKKILEQELGKPVLHFASPFGYSNEAIRGILKDAGYKTARTTYKGIYHTKDDLLRLRGILISDNFDDFVAVLNR